MKRLLFFILALFTCTILLADWPYLSLNQKEGGIQEVSGSHLEGGNAQFTHNGYQVLAFTTAGESTLTVNTAGTYEVLVVGGGGSSGGGKGGVAWPAGGGGGEVLRATVTLSKGEHTVIVAAQTFSGNGGISSVGDAVARGGQMGQNFGVGGASGNGNPGQSKPSYQYASAGGAGASGLFATIGGNFWDGSADARKMNAGIGLDQTDFVGTSYGDEGWFGGGGIGVYPYGEYGAHSQGGGAYLLFSGGNTTATSAAVPNSGGGGARGANGIGHGASGSVFIRYIP